MEWNWDWAWWQSPKRVVTPTKSETRKPAEEQPQQAEVRTAPVDAAPEKGPSPAEQVVKARRDARPFFQLYLVSGQDSKSPERGEFIQRLQNVGAKSCASALEALCVPLGRSSNPTECYVLYEDRGEFEAAKSLAPLLDVPALRNDASPNAAESAFALGVGTFYAVVEAGPIVEKQLVEKAEKRLAEAAQAPNLPNTQRWAAAILASRLMTEYKYDYAAARSYCVQAERLAAPDSLEQMTAFYWRADALTQGGQSSEAAGLRQRIEQSYGSKVTRSQLLQRTRAGQKEKKKS